MVLRYKVICLSKGRVSLVYLLDCALHQCSAQLSLYNRLSSSTSQVYSSTEHLATPSNLSFSSDRSHSEEKEDRGDIGGLSPSLSPAESSVERRHAGRMARYAQLYCFCIIS